MNKLCFPTCSFLWFYPCPNFSAATVILVQAIQRMHNHPSPSVKLKRSVVRAKRRSSKNIFRSHLSDRFSSLIINLIFSFLKNERGVRVNFISSIMILLFLFSATMAISLMNTNSSATFRTNPSNFFIANKFSYTVFLNIFKIFNLAHIVFSSVSF